MSIRASLALVLLCAAAASAWGPVGHEVTASVAQAFLSSNAQSQVSSILNGQQLSDVANWADSVKHSAAYSWSGVLHYINTPDNACTYQYSRDCGDAICVAGALNNYTARLVNPSLPSQQITEALEFLVHFAGDIHQPLHVGFTTDEGGNTIKGDWEGKSTNLHMVWDVSLVTARVNDFGGDQNQYVSYLVSQLQGPWSSQAKSWGSCPSAAAVCPDPWASESVKLACSNAYTDQNGNSIQSGFSLGQDYYNFNQQVLDQQFAKGGIRLAYILNTAFGSAADDALPSNL